MSEYTPRLEAPGYDDPWWIHTSRGGNNPCILIEGNSVLPNCVGYAFGRFSEILGEQARLCRGDAGTWFGYTQDGYNRGTSPRVGAVMCFAKPGDAGHVCIVEQVFDDGSIITSESGYGSPRFWTSTRYPNYNKGAYIFQGFIYNPAADTGTAAQPGNANPDNPAPKATKLSEFIETVVGQIGTDGQWTQSQCNMYNGSNWSAAFVTACAKSTGGLIDTIFQDTTSCSAFARSGVANGYGEFHKGPNQGEVFTPGEGDIILFRYAPGNRYDEYDCDAIGVVRQVSRSKVYVVQGDCMDLVMLKFYNVDSNCISGYYRPNWEAVGATSGLTGNMDTLYEEETTRYDAIGREIGYLDDSYQPSINSSDVRLSVINYTNLLGDLFDYMNMQQADKTVATGSSHDNVITDDIPDERIRIALDYLMDCGLNAAASCGVCANIQRESGFNTASVGDNGTSFGICQWHLGRGEAMKMIAGYDWSSNLTGQLEYLWTELSGGYSYVLAGLQSVTNNLEGAKQATDIFVRRFEVPANVDNESNLRQAIAEDFWSRIVVQ